MYEIAPGIWICEWEGFQKTGNGMTFFLPSGRTVKSKFTPVEFYKLRKAILNRFGVNNEYTGLVDFMLKTKIISEKRKNDLLKKDARLICFPWKSR